MEIVPPEEARSGYPFAILVGEIPGAEEAKQGRPFVGPSGWEMNRALQAVGIRRNRCHVTNAVLCHPPGAASGALDRIDKQVATRRKNGDTEVLTPVEACRPRLLREIEGLGCKDVVPLGGVAMRAITGMRSKILEVRGGPQNVDVPVEDERRVVLRMLPTVHPAFVMRSRRWTGAFVADLGRAMRWFTSGLRWQDPVTLFRPSPVQLRAWIARASRAVIYDVETAPAFPSPKASECRYDPMRDPLRVVGLCNEDARSATVIPFRSKEDVGRSFYTLNEYRELIDILRAFFVSSKIKVGWNSGYYDRMVIESHFKVTPAPHIDLIGLHKFVEPELPHSLGYAGSIYTDVNAWKQGRPAESSETDQDLWTYNAKDTAVTAMSMGPIVQAVKDRKQEKPAAFWPFVQDLCVQLHRNGMHVDQVKRQEWDAKMLRLAQEHLRVIRDASGKPRMNPGSFPQVGGLLFDDWELLPVNYTEGGEPSTDDESLREIMAKQTLTPAQRTTIENVRLYRRRCKYRGTYTQKLRPMNEPPVAEAFSFDEEAEEEDKVLDRLKRGRPKSGVILADGRVHGDWNAHGTLGWRISSSAPNLQNYPNLLRDMIDAAPGWCLVGCDQAQLELRMVAAMAGARAYLAAFASGGDPHGELCVATFGSVYENAAKDPKKLFRRFVKEGTYASVYQAEIETVHGVLASAEDQETERLVFPDISISKVAAFHRVFTERNPEIPIWWETLDKEFSEKGYLTEDVLGLRCDFLDGAKDPQLGNKMSNFKAQSGGSAIVHIATKRFVENMPKDWHGRVLIVNQGHDSLTCEVKADHPGPQVLIRNEKGEIKERRWCADPNCGCLPSKVGRFLEECFTIDGNAYGLPVPFLGEMQIGNTWKET
jgi:DNA polymerase